MTFLLVLSKKLIFMNYCSVHYLSFISAYVASIFILPSFLGCIAYIASPSLSSNRQHLSSVACLGVKRTVVHSDMHTREQFLHFCILGLDFFLCVCLGFIFCVCSFMLVVSFCSCIASFCCVGFSFFST